MRYGISGISNDEIITKYFERNEDILVRYRNGKTDIVDYDSRDYLDDIMREQAHSFVKQQTDVTREVIEEYIFKTIGGAYIITVAELIIRGLFGKRDPLVAGLGLGMWVVGENLYSYLVYEKGFTIGEAKAELEMIKKYKLFLKHEKRILEYLKDNPRDVSGKINDLDVVKYDEIKEIVKLSKRKK